MRTRVAEQVCHDLGQPVGVAVDHCDAGNRQVERNLRVAMARFIDDVAYDMGQVEAGPDDAQPDG